MDTMNGKGSDAVARALRPQDYVEGRGLSAAGKRVEQLLHEADLRAEYELPPEADTSWMNPRNTGA